MTYTVTLEYTDDAVAVTFAGDCAGTWGKYVGTRADSNAWLLAGRAAMERRYAEVAGIDGVTHGNMSWDLVNDRDEQQWRWICEECPLAALAAMCAEWGGPR